jgi:uncharacterized peroxidase-related enzyme
MSFIATIAPDAAEGAAAEMYRRQQASWGFVPNYATIFSHRPNVMARWGQLLAELKRPMNARRFELVTFAAAHALGNTACSLVHGKALRAFFDDAEIVAIAEDRLDGVLDAAEQAMLRFARQVALDASQVTAATVNRLAAHGFADAEIFDIAAAAAGRAFFTKLLDALGVQADAPMGELSAPLRCALTVGRSIDVQPPATMRLVPPSDPPMTATAPAERALWPCFIGARG